MKTSTAQIPECQSAITPVSITPISTYHRSIGGWNNAISIMSGCTCGIWMISAFSASPRQNCTNYAENWNGSCQRICTSQSSRTGRYFPQPSEELTLWVIASSQTVSCSANQHLPTCGATCQPSGDISKRENTVIQTEAPLLLILAGLCTVRRKLDKIYSRGISCRC